MAYYRNALPQLTGGLFLTDGGIGTTLIFHEGLELPDFAAFHLLRSPQADIVCAITMNDVEEALGIVRATQQADMPVVISFTVETDGRLPTGQPLKGAIEQVDEATSHYPCYYMINCAHPTHFERMLVTGEPWVERIRGLRANASRMSHAELNEFPELDTGNPAELGREYAQLKTQLRQRNVMDGCCGTDHRHTEQIASACLSLFRDTT